MALVVAADDDLDIRQLMERVLDRAGHRVIAVADGVQALEAVLTHRPALLITDVDMPRMNGLDLCAAVRRDPALRLIPVIVASAAMRTGDPLVHEFGATAVLPKPFRLQQLRDVVTRALERTRTPRQAPQ